MGFNPWQLPHIPNLAHYNWSPTIPKFYWAVKSQEQRLLHLCREQQRLTDFVEFLVDEINTMRDVINRLTRTSIIGVKPVDVVQDDDANTATISLDQQDIIDNGLIGSELDKKLEAHNIYAGEHITLDKSGNNITIHGQNVYAEAPLEADITENATTISLNQPELETNLLEDGAIKDKLDSVDEELDKKLNTTDLATLRSHSTELVVPVHYHTASGASADFLNLGQPSDTHTRLGITLRSTNSYLVNAGGELAVDAFALSVDSAVGVVLGLKLEASNIHAGSNITLDTNGNDITINSEVDISTTSRVVRHLITGEDSGDESLINGGYGLVPITLASDEWVTAMGYVKGTGTSAVHMPEASYEYTSTQVHIHLWAVEGELALGDTICWCIQKGGQRVPPSTTDTSEVSRVVAPPDK